MVMQSAARTLISRRAQLSAPERERTRARLLAMLEQRAAAKELSRALEGLAGGKPKKHAGATRKGAHHLSPTRLSIAREASSVAFRAARAAQTFRRASGHFN